MFSSLDRIDIVTQNEETGRRNFLQTDHRSAAEIQHTRELSILFALARMLNARQAIEPEESVDVLYVCAEPPPEFLRSTVASTGGRIQVNDEPVSIYEGPIGMPEDLANDTFRVLAHRVAQERGVPLGEPLLEALQRESLQAPDVEEDESGFWTRVTERAAVTGELLRSGPGGRWVDASQSVLGAALPFVFRLGRDGASTPLVNVVGKAERFLKNGERDSLLSLLRMAEDQSLQASSQPRPVMLSLKPPDWKGRDKVLCRPLADLGPQQAVPLMAYGEDLPHSFALFMKGGPREAQLDALHAQALENLRAVSPEVQEVGEGPHRLIAVSGHFFAAEKVLDVAFMRGLHERLHSPLLLAGIPRKGLLLVMNGKVEPRVSADLLALCAREHQKPDAEPLSPTPFILHEGVIRGVLRPGEAPEGPPAPAAAPTAERKPRWGGFFSWLFGKKT